MIYKKNPFILAGAMSFALGSLALVGCSNDDLREPTNPSYDGNAVKTQLAISIGSGSGATGSRMSETIVQGTNNFRGMDSIFIFESSNTGITNEGFGTINSIVNLRTLSNNDISTTTSSKIYSDISVSVGTQSFLFYGKATKDTNVPATSNLRSGVYEGLNNGYTKFGNLSTIVSTTGINFSHQTIDIPSSSDFQEKVATRLSAIANTDDWAANTTLQTALRAFANPYAGLGGSSNAILQRLQILVDLLDETYNEAATDDDTKTLIDAIKENIYDGTVFQKNATTNKVEFVSTDPEYKNFPAYYGLPEGAAILTCSVEDTTTPTYTFGYSTNGTLGSESQTQLAMDKVVYPAELMYYVATPVLATATAIADTEWNKTVSTWNSSPTTASVTWENTVRASTTSIALKHNINYGVAQLQTTVQARSNTLQAKKTTNEGYNSTLDPEDPNNLKEITLADADNQRIQWTGLLIGGQAETVDYQFLPTSADGDYVVYDKLLAPENYVLTTTQSGKNYTLVFDNYNSTNDQTEKVNIALQFVNNTNVSFLGVDGEVIKPGMTFYLIGRLNNSNSGNTSTDSFIAWDTLSLPTEGDPASVTDDTKKYFPRYGKDRIFVQDFTTTANITINSLKNAYVTVPDLRSSKLQLGFSVDLSWKTGLSFDVAID